MRVPTLGCSRIQKILSRKRGITLSKKIGGLPPLLVWVSLLIVNNYSEFQVNIFSNNRDIRKCQSFCTTTTTPPTTTPGLLQYFNVFSENSRANNAQNKFMLFSCRIVSFWILSLPPILEQSLCRTGPASPPSSVYHSPQIL